MAARLGQKLDVKEARAVELAAAGRSTQDMVQAAAATMVAYVVRHHAFLRGALDWKFSHHTYLILVETLYELHVVALARSDDEHPAHLDDERTARFFQGGTLDLRIQQLAATEQDAREGKEPDEQGLTEDLLRLMPSWYTGLRPEDPIPDDLVMDELFAEGPLPEA